MRFKQNLDCAPSSPVETGKRSRRAGSYGGVSGETGITVQSVNWLNSSANKEGVSCNEKLIFDDAPQPNSPTFSGPAADTANDHQISGLSSRSVQCRSTMTKEPTCSPSRSTIVCGAYELAIAEKYKERVSCNEKLNSDDESQPTAPTSSASASDASDDLKFATDLSQQSVQCESTVVDEPLCSPNRSAIDVHGTYEREIYRNMHERETRMENVWGYLAAKQKDIGVNHRKILINWLVEFAEEFKLRFDTLVLGVAILDQFLGKSNIATKRSSLQLLGIACMVAAVKFEETQPSRIIQECCDITDLTFTSNQVIDMEASVLKVLDYDCALITVGTFIWWHLRVCGAGEEMEKLALYLLSLTILEYDSLQYFPSIISASAVFLAGHILGKEPWPTSLQECTGLTPKDLKVAVEHLQSVHVNTRTASGSRSVLSVQRKFEKTENMRVSTGDVNYDLPLCLYE